MGKTIHMISLGCPKNLVDAEVMLGQFQERHYQVGEDPEEADILLVNTCGFIQSAVEEGIDAIMELARFKKADPDKLLVVTGCMVQRYGEDLARELPEVDLFIGTDGFQDILARIDGYQQARLTLAAPTYLMDSRTPRTISTPGHRAYLKVTEGCNNRCSYCLIPSLRGPLRSRSVADLCREATALEAKGVKELTLIAQDLTAYGLDFGDGGSRLADLLAALVRETAIPWIRMLYLHPSRLRPELLEYIASQPRILPYLDLPLQHVSDRLLRLMHRPYDRAAIARMLGDIRHYLPEAALRSTFIVGFPGETEEDVDQLAAFLRHERLDHVGVFPYSNEPGCRAESLPDHLPEEVKLRRRDAIMALQAEISLAKNRRRIGTTMEVLVEGVSRESEFLLAGRTRYQAPEIDGCVYITDGRCAAGDLVSVTVSDAHQYDLVGAVIDQQQE